MQICKKGKKIVIITLGSRGDIQPYIPLGKTLKERGHEVTIVAQKIYQTFIEEQDLKFAPIAGDFRKIHSSPIGQKMISTGMGFMSPNLIPQDLLYKMMQDAYKASRNAEADILIHTSLSLWVRTIAQKMKLPCLFASVTPVEPTGDFPLLKWGKSPKNPLLRSFYRFTYYLGGWFYWQSVKPAVCQFRQEMQMPSYSFFKDLWIQEIQKKNRIPLICGVSPSIIPKPDDWRQKAYLTGYWFLDVANYQPDPHLEKFLEEGNTPLCISFGSVFPRKGQVFETILEFLEITEQRAIILKGWAETNLSFPSNCIVLESVPHDWLFSRVKGVIHHGGSGTTAAVLRAGIPQIIISFFVDQPFWGEVISKQGLGEHIPFKSLSLKKLVNANGIFDNPTIKVNAQLAQAQIKKENGLNEAAILIEKLGEKYVPCL